MSLVSEDSDKPYDNVTLHPAVRDEFGFTCSSDGPLGDRPASALLAELNRRRELKWIKMMHDWDAYMRHRYLKVRDRCRKGIPRSVRAQAWIYLSGAHALLDDPDCHATFKRCCSEDASEQSVSEIERDLHRNFPDHELFGGEFKFTGRQEFFTLLKAYAVYNAQIGYCQAMAPLAALLLMNMPTEHAFWVMVIIVDKYVPGYYSTGMEAVQIDAAILGGLLKRRHRPIYRHLKRQGVDPILFMCDWFLCIYSRTLPWPAVLRIWDMFLCEGVKILFKVALILVVNALPSSVRKASPTMCETLQVLKNLPSHVTSVDFLMPRILKLELHERELQEEYRKQTKIRHKKTKKQT